MSLAKWISDIAPVLGSAVGGKAGELVGNIAKSAIVELFDLPEDAGEDQIIAALKANPEIALKLKEAELNFLAKMEAAKIDWEKIASDDRDSARKRQMAIKDKTPSILGGLLIAGFFGVLYFILTEQLPQGTDKMLVGALLGTLGTMSTQVVNFFFGSSSGSKQKTKIIGNIKGGKNG